MKKTKVIIPALGILLLSTAASVTGTVAWFSANTFVTGQGMFVQAKADYGIVISNSSTGTFAEKADSLNDAVTQLKPGSTADLSTWLYSKSTQSATANTGEPYEAGQPWNETEQVGNYVAHSFYLRSSTDTDIALSSLDVKSVSAKVKDSDPAADSTNELSKALRVGVKFSGSTLAVAKTLIYAPVSGHDATNSIQAAAGAYSTDGRITVTPKEYNAKGQDDTITTLPKKSGTPLLVNVYIWYEGEDTHCISDNIITGLDALSVSVEFSYTAA